MSEQYPSIPVPVQDLASHQTVLKSMKEVIEMMAGVCGTGALAQKSSLGGSTSLTPHTHFASEITDFDPAVMEVMGYFNVKNAPFNAVGDGVADDTAAIQAAIAACGVGGGIVFFPVGAYKHTGLSVTTNCVVLLGEVRSHFYVATRGVNLVYAGVLDGNWITVGASVDTFIINSIHMNKDSGLTLTGGYAISLNKPTSARIINTKIVTPYNGIYQLAGSGTRIEGSLVGNYSGSVGIHLFSTVADGILVDTAIYDTLSFSDAYKGDAFLLEGNVATAWFRKTNARECLNGVRLVGYSDGSRPGDIEFTDCVSERCAQEGVNLVNYGGLTFDNYVVANCGNVGHAGFSRSGFKFGAGGAFQVVRLTSCNVGSCGLHGYEIDASSSRISMINCGALGNSVTAINTGDGVHINGASQVQIIGGQYGGNNLGNVAVPRHRYGINIVAGSSNFLIDGADVRGNVTAGILDAGSTASRSYIVNCLGYESRSSGRVTATPDVNGIISCPIALGATPAAISTMATLLGAGGAADCKVQSQSAAQANVRIFDTTTGAVVTAGTFTVMWQAQSGRA